MPYTTVTKPISTAYSSLNRDIINYPVYGVAIYGTSKYGLGNPYTPIKSPSLFDNYDQKYQNADLTFSTLFRGYSESFQVLSSGTLSHCAFLLKKLGSPTGNLVSKIYAIGGTYGTNAIPTGSALAASDNFSVSALSQDYNLHTITFSGVNQITLSPNYYCVTLEYASGTATDTVKAGADQVFWQHGGNAGAYALGSWSNISSPRTELVFYVYKNPNYTTISKPT